MGDEIKIITAGIILAAVMITDRIINKPKIMKESNGDDC